MKSVNFKSKPVKEKGLSRLKKSKPLNADVSPENEVPTEKNKVDEIKAYMDEHQIEYNEGDTKAVMIDKIVKFHENE